MDGPLSPSPSAASARAAFPSGGSEAIVGPSCLHARMESGRRAINILNGVPGFAVFVIFLIPFLLRSGFENYLSIRETLEKRKWRAKIAFERYLRMSRNASSFSGRREICWT